jgi:8-oxo-dGTP pyrophosphatase MutT (NUDIX family)
MPETYRQAASILVLLPAPNGSGPLRFLLIHKPRRRDAWQLPQGGIEAGETAGEAAIRELSEEAGIHDVTLLGQSKEVYQYDFPASFRRFRPDDVRGQRIEFFVAKAAHDRVQVDGKEIDQAIWINASELPRYIKRRAYLQLVRRVLDEGRALLTSAR